MQLKILPKIKSPADIRKLSEDELLQPVSYTHLRAHET